MTMQQLARQVSLATSGLFASPAFAAAPIYFDAGGVLLYLLTAVLGLLVFPLCLAFSKSKQARRTFGWLSIGCIVGLAVPFLSGSAKSRQVEQDRLAAAQTFAEFCKSAHRVSVPGSSVPAARVRVRHHGSAAGVGGAARLARLFHKDPVHMCIRSSIVAFAPEVPGEGEEAHYAVCPTTAARPDAGAEYDLLIRDAHDSRSAGGHVLHKSTMALTRIQDQRLISQADFFFGSGRFTELERHCPWADDETLKDFLAAALPKD
jgi:hypothetical protein